MAIYSYLGLIKPVDPKISIYITKLIWTIDWEEYFGTFELMGEVTTSVTYFTHIKYAFIIQKSGLRKFYPLQHSIIRSLDKF